MVNCNTPYNNLTYCGLDPLEKLGHIMTTSNYGLPPNWVILLGGVCIIVLYCLVLNKAGFFNDAETRKEE